MVEMADDGSGIGIRIPSVMISKKHGDILLEHISSILNDPNVDEDSFDIVVLGQMIFNISRPDNRVEYDIWYSSSNDMALDFI